MSTASTMTTLTCAFPPGVLNAHWTLIGQTLQYQCANGFWMTGGSASRTCQANQWSGKPPVCTLINNKPVIHNSLFGNSNVLWWLPILFATFFGVIFLSCLLILCLYYCCGFSVPLYKCCRCPSFSSKHRRRDSYDNTVPAEVYVVSQSGRATKLNRPNRVGTKRTEQDNNTIIDEASAPTERVKHEYFTRLPNGDLIPFTKPRPYKPPKHRQQEENYLRLPNGEIIPVIKKKVKNFKSSENRDSNPSSFTQTYHNALQNKHSKSQNIVSSDDGMVPVDSPGNSELYMVDHVLLTNRNRNAKELHNWMPHSKPVRNINTSTK